MNDASFEAFVAERSSGLLRTATLLTGDPGTARDLLQTALIAVHRHRSRLADAAEATARARRELVAARTGWLDRLWIGDLLASSTLLAGVSGLPGFGPPVPDAGPPPDATVAAVTRLPRRLGAALVLRYGEDLPETAVAAALGCPVEEVRIGTQRGLTRLRRLLDDAAPDDAPRGSAALDDAALADRLRRGFAALGARAPVAADGLADQVRDGQRAGHRHRAGLAALLAFVVLVVLLAVTL